LLHIETHLADDLGQLLALRLLLQDGKRTQQGQARVDHRCELTREDREILELDLLPRQKLDLSPSSLALDLDLEGDEALLAKTREDEIAAVRLKLTG
jgi:hypothetical protein